VDVTSSLLNWFGSVPDNSTISFPAGACYRIEGTLELRGRSGLDFEGNGVGFESFSPPSDQRALWRIIGSRNMTFHNMVLRGSYPSPGTFDSALQHAHAIDVRGSSVDVGSVQMSNFAGDCIYLGLGYDNATRSTGSVHDSTCTGTSRNGISLTATSNVLIQRNTFSKIGLNVLDVEPNMAAGNWGSDTTTFDSNTIGTYRLYALAVVEQGPISNQTFTNNTFSGAGMRIGMVQPSGFRPKNIVIGSNTASMAITPSAIDAQGVDGLSITNNVVPLTSGTLASVSTSCGVSVSGNRFPGGSTELSLTPYSGCPASGPSIAGLSPQSGAVGTAVTITGTGLGTARSVTFNGVTASFAVLSDSSITASVPASAVTGVVSVTTSSGVASYASFTVTTTAPPPAPAPSPPPTLSSLSPDNGLAGTVVTLTGSGFTGATNVSFNGASASFTVVSGTQITATAPAGVTSGPVSVTTPNGTTSSTRRFRVHK
jgi:hypothetical protein